MRVVVFFVLVFAGILAPVGAALVTALMGPPAYVLSGEGPGAEWFEERAFSDGSHILVRRYDNEGEAEHAARRIADAVPTSFENSLLSVTRYRRSDNGGYGLVLPVDRYVVHIEAPNAETVDTRFNTLGFVRENPKKNPVWIAFTDGLPITFAAIAVYVALFGLFMIRSAAWAARISPAAAAAPMPLPTLRERLLEINRLGQPFQVKEIRPGRLVAEWRIVDARWVGVLEAGGLRYAHRIHLDLDEKERKARVVDTSQKVCWEATGAHLVGSFSLFQGIAFAQFERGFMGGLLYDRRTGWSIREGYNYRFSLAEMKMPLIEAVTQSGWTWQPVVTFFRPIAVDDQRLNGR